MRHRCSNRLTFMFSTSVWRGLNLSVSYPFWHDIFKNAVIPRLLRHKITLPDLQVSSTCSDWVGSFILVRVARLELTTPWPPVKCATNCATPGFYFVLCDSACLEYHSLYGNASPFFKFLKKFLLRWAQKFCWQTAAVYGIIFKCLRFKRPCRLMERCPSGWRNRSWKPATWKRPWVRIPLSPPILSWSAEVPKRPKGLPC